jgi:hypothetical protein
MTFHGKACFAALAILVAASSAALAQTRPSSNGCSVQERSNKTLENSDQKNAGVICPPDVDPAMKAPTPPTGDAAVIPPPGSPGGDPSVQPK